MLNLINDQFTTVPLLLQRVHQLSITVNRNNNKNNRSDVNQYVIDNTFSSAMCVSCLFLLLTEILICEGNFVKRLVLIFNSCYYILANSLHNIDRSRHEMQKEYDSIQT